MRIGVDMVSIARIVHSLSVSDGFAARVFSAGERDQAAHMAEPRAHEFLAGRFAVKEAVLKAMRSGAARAIALDDIETLTAEDGAPELRLTASALHASELLRITQWQVSISHENGLAIALVVAHDGG